MSRQRFGVRGFSTAFPTGEDFNAIVKFCRRELPMPGTGIRFRTHASRQAGVVETGGMIRPLGIAEIRPAAGGLAPGTQ